MRRSGAAGSMIFRTGRFETQIAIVVVYANLVAEARRA